MNYKNIGSAAVEATIAVPVFVVAMITIFYMGRCMMARAVIYEAVVETSEYLAETGYYNTTGIVAPKLKFEEYIDNTSLVNQYVDGGIKGISFLGSYIDENHEVIVNVSYKVAVRIPLFDKLKSDKGFTIRQKVYNGYAKSNEEDNETHEEYVYITDNQEVYHKSRNCTYLQLSISGASIEEAEAMGYRACEFCGKEGGSFVYVTEEGRCWHSSLSCSGLKRTVYRVKKSQVPDKTGCSRCGR